MRGVALGLVALVLIGCAERPGSQEAVGTAEASGPTASTSHVGPLEPGAFPPGAPNVVAARSVASSARPILPPEPATVRLARVTADRGEDGLGHTVAATHPVAVDLVRAHGWPGGALATSLTIGSLRFHDVQYPSITTMRFVVADESLLPRGAEVALETGSALRRRVLAPSLPEAR